MPAIVTTELDPDCPDCATRAEAQACFPAPRPPDQDPHGLDGDGVGCEA